MSVVPQITLDIDYDKLQDSIDRFIQHFKQTPTLSADMVEAMDDNDDNTITDAANRIQQMNFAGPKYLELLQKVANREVDTVVVNLDDVQAFDEEAVGNEALILPQLLKNTTRYIEMFCRAVDKFMPQPTIDVSRDDVVDVLLHQRQQRNEHLRAEAATTGGEAETGDLFPASLTRRYTLYFAPLTPAAGDPAKLKHAFSVRELRGEMLGTLVTVRGVVSRASDVKPSVQVNAYTCDTCGNEVFQEVVGRQFQPIVECPSVECKSNDARGQLFMSTRASKFVPYQDLRIQELADQVPVGHIPRTLSVHVKGPLVRSAAPGDVVDIAGIFTPSPYTGFRAIKAGLLTDVFLDAQHITQHKKQYDQLDLNPQVIEKVRALCAEGNIYERLAYSIAPEIYGHQDVKKALVLLLTGGVTKEVQDGMRIRGDINVCLMGDPGVAKSQLLKFITKVAPRGVYTTGRGSSGVGLTAAVIKDPVTDEMVLEGGALVLADNGICCIDEFDKMDDNDRTAIHEVMEQQTISISKAGITTTLNARTSVLAAANPLYGRYNPRLSPVENINLPAALLSRFDIMFLILDKPTREDDERLAAHVTYVHTHGQQPESAVAPLDPATIRQYIAVARQFRPTVPKEVSDHVIAAYVRMRQDYKREQEHETKKLFSHTTPRSLLAVLRMAQALARLRMDTEVRFEDVDEALRLLEVCKDSLYDKEHRQLDLSPSSRIYHLVRNMAYTETGHLREVPMARLYERALARGFTQDQVNECLREYSELDIWHVTDDGETLNFVL